MISPISSALSALNAAGKKLGNSAHNIANSNTEGFKASRVVLSEESGGGVTARINTVEAAQLPPETPYSSGIIEHSNVDIGTEMVEQITASHLYKANIKTLQTADEMQKTLLNIKA